MRRSPNTIILVIVIAVLVIVTLAYFDRQNEPSTRVGKAAEEVGEGLEDAARKLKPESERTVGERIGDRVEKLGENIKESSEK